MPYRKSSPMHLRKPLLVSVLVSTVVAVTPAAALAADSTPPVLAVPADVHYQQKQAGSVVRMTYKIGVHDDADAHPQVDCLPRSGSRFPIGTTTVTCTAKDASGNTARGSFRITVTAKSHTRVIPAARAVRPHLTARAYRRSAQ